MSKQDQYHPNYKRIYPGVHINADILFVLKKSDRKMEYMERDLKEERFAQSQEKKTATFFASREDSYDRLAIEEGRQFADETELLEDAVVHQDEIRRLRECLGRLDHDELDLIHALFFEELTERECAKRFGISQKGINKRCHRILGKLRNMLIGSNS